MPTLIPGHTNIALKGIALVLKFKAPWMEPMCVIHRIEARAYALYATTGMVESDIINVRIGDPAPPLDLKIQRPR